MMSISGNIIVRAYQHSSLSTVVSILLLGLKQQYPDKILPIFNFGSRKVEIKCKYLQFLYVYGWYAINIIFRVEYDWRLTFSSMAGWFYLKYYMYTKTSSIRGDPRREFEFVEQLPQCTRKYLKPAANYVFKAAINWGIIPKGNDNKSI